MDQRISGCNTPSTGVVGCSSGHNTPITTTTALGCDTATTSGSTSQSTPVVGASKRKGKTFMKC